VKGERLSKVALVDKYGAFLSAKEGRFQLYVKNRKVWDLAPVELDAIVFAVTGASISASAVKLANEFGIDLVFLDGNQPVARLIQARYGSTLKTWLHQLKAYKSLEERVRLAKCFVEGKLHNQRMVLAEYYKYFKASGKSFSQLASAISSLEEALENLACTSTIEEVRSIEAHAARHYWNAVSTLLPREAEFKQRLPRSRQLPGVEVDLFNKALNIGYAALSRAVWKAVFMAGLNPYIGFLHKPRAGKMALVFDLMEEFRPIAVDRPLTASFRRSFEEYMDLKDDDREAARKVWKVVVNRMYESKPPLESIIMEQARLLAKHVRGTDKYRPFKARW